MGRKNQIFFRFISLPKNRYQKGKYNTCFGYWDVRKNKNLKSIVLNMYALFFDYYKGSKPNKTLYRQIYYFCINSKCIHSWMYFKESQIFYFIENEIKKKYL